MGDMGSQEVLGYFLGWDRTWVHADLVRQRSHPLAFCHCDRSCVYRLSARMRDCLSWLHSNGPTFSCFRISPQSACARKKKKKNIIHMHTLAYACIHWHTLAYLSYTVSHWHALSYTVMHSECLIPTSYSHESWGYISYRLYHTVMSRGASRLRVRVRGLVRGQGQG